ncbi:MAG TPA: 30S ribosomal protein S17 [Candidatus Eisenbacteria bacterium]|nr:30S ribosomal protein S17 [Candidatus Eisenbacteria bacterium]
MSGRRKHREGLVVSNKMDKTVVVIVERLVRHARYEKYLRQRERYKAHDEQNRCQIGDRVRLIETRPLSRGKRWAVEAILSRSEALADVIAAAEAEKKAAQAAAKAAEPTP